MSFTSFDRALAKEFMDKNNDGKCDSCGMPVDMCIDSGQMQCNTDTKSTIGDLGTQHIHADWKVYINRQPVDFNGKDHMTRMRSNSSVSSFIHVDSGAPSPEKTGDLLHMHAKGVPLWIFFESIEMELPDSIIVYVNSTPDVFQEYYSTGVSQPGLFGFSPYPVNVTVNGIQAPVSSNIFSASVLLSEGANTITATATDTNNNTASDSINVTLVTKGNIRTFITPIDLRSRFVKKQKRIVCKIVIPCSRV